ncbi:MAG TPA: electron transport complex subunit RsxC [Thiothrix sp.]|nr:electron transport complex subunit RsxC [Thiothrix sp.]
MISSSPHIWPLKGGVHPDFHKEESTQQAIAIAPLPDKLIVPIRQHIGELGKLVVHVNDYVYKGQVLTTQPKGLGSLTHAPTSGTIVDSGRYPIPHVSGFSCPGIILKPDGKEDWGEHRLTPYSNHLSVHKNQLLERLYQAGLVGLGGAAFPSMVKISAADKATIKTLIINAAECEPYITCDDMLMRENANELIQGILILIQLLQPEQCLIGIEENKPEAIAAMQDAVATTNNNVIKLVAIPSIYPSGDEKQLIQILTGIAIPKSILSFDYGILCHNIATVHSIYNAVVKGEPLISRTVTVTGSGVKHPQNFKALIGTPFHHLINTAGGYTKKAERLLMGGPMMGFAMQTDEVPVVKATNCILALSEAELPYSLTMAMPCIRCGKCADVCPVDLLPQQLYWHARAEDLEKVQQHKLFDCIECGCCSYVCPSNIPLVSYYRHAKGAVKANAEKLQKIDKARERHEYREFRLQREKDERKAKLAKHKAALQKKKAAMAAAKANGNNKQNDVSDVIKAAMERTKAKKAAAQQQAKHYSQPRNTDNLTAAQQQQIDQADARRTASTKKHTETDSK